jgi:hypothetical protein
VAGVAPRRVPGRWRKKAPAAAGACGFDLGARRYIAADDDDEVAIASDEDDAIASDDEAIASDADDEAIASDDETGAALEDDEAGAALDDDDTGAALDELSTTAELELDGVTGAVVGVPRLKIQIRPTITITATMMIIQVLRFMGFALGWRRVDWGVSSVCLTLSPLPCQRSACLIRRWRR